ncbi:MAG: nicotinic acid mononucleotide adenylyltransferase [Bacteroidetes bacterium]|jgi:nicotinate-nucleotide adenylyltransferase|nr:nicotinate-nucleotide adenylyltransferase [Bacteroidota bacterium]MCO4790809.1 nicotinate-nucleotide adenylyltransferase [Flavobacteriales bacterium]MDA8576989.1 nicotinate (nicotinamide) nucleotide adenylyltransferase [Schleiferiaceae bacterium]MDA9286105.1 nicotinate (nicotinamide) nucleotide adenylyltransferase [Schleiferiaceae bacterium]MDB2404563.1 nicotinate (nicotinamide) nucleotide adenylyltransferase [Schleiferiaceae bacterium]
MKGNIGLFFGTFNPIHIGHLALAEYFYRYTELDQICFVVTPHNPFKKKSTLLPDRERLHLVHLALEDQEGMTVSAIEFSLPQPNYTAQTLAYLREQHPEAQFSLIMGEDNLRGLHKWKNVESIVELHDIYVYPRHSNEVVIEHPHFDTHPKITVVPAPRMEISATLIRSSFKEGKPLRNLLPKAVFEYIEGSNLFQ